MPQNNLKRKDENVEDLWDGKNNPLNKDKGRLVNQEMAKNVRPVLPKKKLPKPAAKREQIFNSQDDAAEKEKLDQAKESVLGFAKKMEDMKKKLGPPAKGSFIKDAAGAQLPAKSYEFKNDAADETTEGEEEEEGEGEEGEEGKEGFDPYEEEIKLKRSRQAEKKNKEALAEAEIQAKEEKKMEVPSEIVAWILGVELSSMLCAPIFFIVLLAEWIALKAFMIFKFPRWKKILTGLMFLFACVESIAFVAVLTVLETKYKGRIGKLELFWDTTLLTAKIFWNAMWR